MADPTDPITKAILALIVLALAGVGVVGFLIATIWKVWHG